MHVLLIVLVSVLAGGAGGFFWGRKVEAKAQAVLGAVKQKAAGIGGAFNAAAQDLKKGL